MGDFFFFCGFLHPPPHRLVLHVKFSCYAVFCVWIEADFFFFPPGCILPSDKQYLRSLSCQQTVWLLWFYLRFLSSAQPVWTCESPVMLVLSTECTPAPQCMLGYSPVPRDPELSWAFENQETEPGTDVWSFSLTCTYSFIHMCTFKNLCVHK